jgi:hypothetical protein
MQGLEIWVDSRYQSERGTGTLHVQELEEEDLSKIASVKIISEFPKRAHTMNSVTVKF